VKTSALVEEHFFLLTPENRHAASPRLAPDEGTVVYFDNPLSTSFGYLLPGPQDMSRRLIKFNLADAILESKMAFQRGILGRVYFISTFHFALHLETKQNTFRNYHSGR
jgi:hypothetical protein